MKRFLQLHMLTAYPPSNLNRDDLGRPKTAVVGGANRLRISSQSLKRAWRTSDVFQEKVGTIEVGGKAALRTKRLGRDVYKILSEGGIKEKDAIEWTRSIAGVFGKIKGAKELFPENLDIEQLAFINPTEQNNVMELARKIAKDKKEPEKEDLDLLRKENTAIDLALFGRMLASAPSFNLEASLQVAHAFSVQKVAVEDDFFTAVDDLNRGDEDKGSGHMGDTEFGSGVFYLYMNLDRELLLSNLAGAGKEAPSLWQSAIQALIQSAATVAPTGKQNSFGSRAYAHYILAELGDQQPRSLSLSFLDPVRGDLAQNSIQALEDLRANMEKSYGQCADVSAKMDVLSGEGHLQEILKFAIQE